MVALVFSERVSSGQGRLDLGITGLTLVPTATGALLVSTSGPRGGIVAYDLAEDGPVSLSDSAWFDIAWSSDALPGARILDLDGAPLIAVAAGGEAGLWTYATDAGGLLGDATLLSTLDPDTGTALDLEWGAATDRLYLADGLNGGIRAFDRSGDTFVSVLWQPDTADTYAEGIVRLASVDRGGQTHVIAASQAEGGVTAFRDTGTALVATGRLGVDEGLDIPLPTVMETARIGDRDVVILGASEAGGTITVMELRPGGALVPLDHVTDTDGTRFGELLAIDVVEVAGRTYVVAAGMDEGITLFTLLPDGRLHLLDVVTAQPGADLGPVTALESWWDGTTLRVFAASDGGGEGGIAVFSASLAGLGTTLTAPERGGVATGGAGNDLIAGSAGPDMLIGGDGDDILTDGAGQDTLVGGAGADRFVLSSDGTGDEIADFDPALDRLDLSAWSMFSDPAQLAVVPTASGAVISWQDETLTLTRAGGGPITAVEIAAAIIDAPIRHSGLDLLGGPGIARQGGAAGDDLSGGPGMDTLFGEDGDDLLAGLGSDDAIFGDAGDDTLIGGEGADRLDGGSGRDTASFAGGQAGVTVRLWAGDGRGGAAEGDRLTDIENLIGSDHADTLVGDAAANLLIGGQGADALWGDGGDDTLDGGPGADLLQGQGGADRARYAGSAAGVTVRLWDGTGRGGHAEGDRLLGIENVEGSDHADVLVGDAGANLLMGGDGADALWGNAGDDTLSGGAGADLLDGQGGLDWACYATSAQGVTVRLWAGDGVGGDAAGDTLRGIENLQGSAFADRLVGDAGANRLLGGAGDDEIWADVGDDTLEGGAGADVLHGQGGTDTVSYAASPQGVTVRLWAGDGWGGDAGGDRLIGIENAEGSTHDDILSGSGGANMLSGLDGRDEVWAGGGNDTLLGGTGNDVLRGQGGDDLLFGGAGADVFVFNDAEGRDTIADFGAGDRIGLRGVSAIGAFEDLQDGAAIDSPEGVRIDTGEGEILIAGLSFANLDLTDFLF